MLCLFVDRQSQSVIYSQPFWLNQAAFKQPFRITGLVNDKRSCLSNLKSKNRPWRFLDLLFDLVGNCYLSSRTFGSLWGGHPLLDLVSNRDINSYLVLARWHGWSAPANAAASNHQRRVIHWHRHRIADDSF